MLIIVENIGIVCILSLNFLISKISIILRINWSFPTGIRPRNWIVPVTVVVRIQLVFISVKSTEFFTVVRIVKPASITVVLLVVIIVIRFIELLFLLAVIESLIILFVIFKGLFKLTFVDNDDRVWTVALPRLTTFFDLNWNGNVFNDWFTCLQFIFGGSIIHPSPRDSWVCKPVYNIVVHGGNKFSGWDFHHLKCNRWQSFWNFIPDLSFIWSVSQVVLPSLIWKYGVTFLSGTRQIVFMNGFGQKQIDVIDDRNVSQLRVTHENSFLIHISLLLCWNWCVLVKDLVVDGGHIVIGWRWGSLVLGLIIIVSKIMRDPVVVGQRSPHI